MKTSELIGVKNRIQNFITVERKKLKKKVGLWIDHRKAVIVSLTEDHEEIKSIASDMEKHVRFSGKAKENSFMLKSKTHQLALRATRKIDSLII